MYTVYRLISPIHISLGPQLDFHDGRAAGTHIQLLVLGFWMFLVWHNGKTIEKRWFHDGFMMVEWDFNGIFMGF